MHSCLDEKLCSKNNNAESVEISYDHKLSFTNYVRQQISDSGTILSPYFDAGLFFVIIIHLLLHRIMNECHI